MVVGATMAGRPPECGRRFGFLAALSAVGAVSLACIGGVSLALWLDGSARLLGPAGGLAAITPLHAALFVVAGAALCVPRGTPRDACIAASGILFLLLGCARGAEMASSGAFLTETAFGLPYDRVHRSPVPLGLAANILAGLSLLLFTMRGRHAAAAWTLVVSVYLASATIMFAGYIYDGVAAVDGHPTHALSVVGCLAAITLSLTLLVMRPGDGWLGVLLRDTMGAAVARRLVAIMVPGTLALGIAVSAIDRGGVPPRLALSGILMAALIGCAVTIWWVMYFVDRIDTHRRVAHAGMVEAISRLKASETRRDLGETLVGAATWEMDPATGEINASDGMRQLHGLSPGFRTNRESMLRCIHPSDRHLMSLDRSCDGSSSVTEYRIIRQDDEEVRWVRATTREVPRGDAHVVVGFSMDVTDTRRARDAATLAKAKKTRFLSQLAHQLSQPVQSLSLFVGLIRGDFLPRDGEAGASRIVASLDRIDSLHAVLASMVAVIREMSLYEKGALPAVPETICLESVIGDLSDEYAPKARGGTILKYSPSSLWVSTDPALIRRIVASLMDNALEFAGGGKIVVGVRRFRGMARITVADSGRGIPEKHRARIFEDFYQVPVASDMPSRGHTGLGLGLSTASRLASRIGSRLNFTSEEGRGSIFYFDLPTVEAPFWAGKSPPPAFSRRPAARPGEGERRLVVVIEDSAMVRDGMAESLSRWGYGVIQASSAEGVLERLGGILPDLIISDYHLNGGENGVGAILAIRQAVRWEVQALIVTADPEVPRMAGVRGSGMVCLTKPVSPDDLRKAVSALLVNHSSVRL